MIPPFLISLLLIGLAELGDKTQLLTIGYATRYCAGVVISGVLTATAALNLIAVIFGHGLKSLIPEGILPLFAGILFIAFGIWMLLSQKEDMEVKKINKIRFLIVFGSFFVAELGDKTQLTTATLAARYDFPFQVWLGATIGMGGMNLLGVLSGSWLKEKVSGRIINLMAGLIFIFFGIVTLAVGLL